MEVDGNDSDALGAPGTKTTSAAVEGEGRADRKAVGKEVETHSTWGGEGETTKGPAAETEGDSTRAAGAKPTITAATAGTHAVEDVVMQSSGSRAPSHNTHHLPTTPAGCESGGGTNSAAQTKAASAVGGNANATTATQGAAIAANAGQVPPSTVAGALPSTLTSSACERHTTGGAGGEVCAHTAGVRDSLRRSLTCPRCSRLVARACVAPCGEYVVWVSPFPPRYFFSLAPLRWASLSTTKLCPSFSNSLRCSPGIVRACVAPQAESIMSLVLRIPPRCLFPLSLKCMDGMSWV